MDSLIKTIVILYVILCCADSKHVRKLSYSEQHQCVLPDELKKEISSYDTVVMDIMDCVLEGPFKRKTYDELSKFVDEFGPRPSGSEVLENAIDYMINITREEDVHDIITEELDVPRWKRGEESVTMVEPRKKKISVIGLGFSVSTPTEGITAEVIVVDNFQQLDDMEDDKVKGKIVLFDAKYESYGKTVKYRTQGATRAAKKGAVVSLVRSITPFSIYSPHTGMQDYGQNVTKIPTAAITLEDADLIRRMYDRGYKIILHVVLLSTTEVKKSRNTIIDYKGNTMPEKQVIVSGHIDSWDVGQGAMDDGGGMIISWSVPVILKYLKLKPKRTIRTIFWTSEELGLVGAIDYAKRHEAEFSNINFVMESDEGTFKPRGLVVAGSQKARCIVAEILKLFSSINATELIEEDRPGSDITTIISKGVPGASLLNQNEKYFWFHHSEGDTMDVEDPDELDLCTAFWTAVAYIIADLSIDIPRD